VGCVNLRDDTKYHNPFADFGGIVSVIFYTQVATGLHELGKIG
jgi:hypothetical protein